MSRARQNADHYSGPSGITDNSNANAMTIGVDESVTFSGDLIPSTPLSNRNHLINGDFQVAQRATSFSGVASTNNDDVYTLDRWNLLSDTDDVVDVTQSSTAPTNQLYSIGLDVETVNKKFGIAQIIEQKNCIGLIGNAVTFSFKAKVSATTKLDNIKCSILEWRSTADAVTSDVVSAWGVEGTNPSFATNWVSLNTAANLNVTTSWATYSVTATGSSGSGCNNFAVFIWSDVTDTTAGDFLYITDCQLEQGSNATPFEHRSYGEELLRCERYYQIIAEGKVGDTQQPLGLACYNVTTELYGAWWFRTTMRTHNCSLEYVNGANYYQTFSGHSYNQFDGFALNHSSDTSYLWIWVTDISGTLGDTGFVRTDNANAKVAMKAEL